MKILAIDYGTLKIGLAISNNNGTIAFPYEIIPNDKHVISTLKNIISKEEVEKIIVGIPQYNKNTPFYKKLQKFISITKKTLTIPIEFQDELLSSEMAKKKYAPKLNNRHDLAAVIILEDYIKKITAQPE